MNTLDLTMRQTLWKLFHDNEQWFEILAQGLREYKKGDWPRSFVDCVFQYDWHHEVDIYDLYVLKTTTVKVNSEMATVAIFQIPVDHEPLSDREVEGNNRLLQGLPAPFKGKFWGGTQDEDGLISWTTPIHVYLCNEKWPGWFIAKPASVQLEVGYNSSGKLFRALNSSGGVARWPYGQTYITVFLNSACMKLYTSGDPEFSDLQRQSGETIEECMISGRGPWDRWREERQEDGRVRQGERTTSASAAPSKRLRRRKAAQTRRQSV